jgi:uncharacterized membrane protein YphA (DoxX/SURF4 family)
MLIAKLRTQKENLATATSIPNPMSRPWIVMVVQLVYPLIRAGIGAVFIWSGVTKLLAPQQFSILIDAYGLIPQTFTLPAAWGLSSLELLAGLGLIWDVRWALTAITGLLLMFILVLSYGIGIGLDVDCGCFGPGDPEGEAYHGMRPALYRDAVMLAGIGYLVLWRRIGSIRPRKLSELKKRRRNR